MLVVSPRGPAGALIPEIRSALVDVRQYRCELRETGAQEEAQACQGFYDGVISARSVVHRGDLALSSALAGARKKESPEAGTWVWSRRTIATDLSPLYAVSLAFWGHSVLPKRPGPWAMVE